MSSVSLKKQKEAEQQQKQQQLRKTKELQQAVAVAQRNLQKTKNELALARQNLLQFVHRNKQTYTLTKLNQLLQQTVNKEHSEVVVLPGKFVVEKYKNYDDPSHLIWSSPGSHRERTYKLIDGKRSFYTHPNRVKTFIQEKLGVQKQKIKNYNDSKGGFFVSFEDILPRYRNALQSQQK